MLSLLLALCVLAGSISAEHYTCTWQIGKEVPTRYSFKHYCAATIASREDQDKVGFACVAGGVGKESTEVADWGYLHPNLLEVFTPCGRGGYGTDSHGHCIAPWWGFCLGEENSGTCLYLASHDDCVWPEFFYNNTLPQKVQIWYYAGNGTAFDLEGA